MDNIKKFEDFLDRMQGLLDNAKKQGHIIVRVEDLENTFPELKESEDVRIRESLITFFQGSPYGSLESAGTNPKEAIAWLDKQGKSALEAVREEKVDNQKMINKIIKEVSDLVTENTIFCTKEVLTSDEAAKYLGMSKSYLYKLTMKQAIPHFKPLGKMCYFNRKELESWLQSNRVATETELEKKDNK